jgi:hypothetical protein
MALAKTTDRKRVAMRLFRNTPGRAEGHVRDAEQRISRLMALIEEWGEHDRHRTASQQARTMLIAAGEGLERARERLRIEQEAAGVYVERS